MIDLLRPPVRRMRTWVHRHNGRLVADLERRYNLNQLQRFEAVLNRHGRSFRTFSSILEFGCGTGRLTQYLFEFAPEASVYGCDVLSDAIARCQRKFPRGRFVTNRATPPLSFADAQCDLIYSYSVFTHLSEPNHQAWLKELGRLLRPGGMMVHTLHSYEYLRRTARFSPESVAKYRFTPPHAGAGFTESAEAFIQSGRDYFYAIDNPSTPEYGHTIIRKEYVMAQWPRCAGLKLLDYVEGAIEAYPEGCQDLVLLMKPQCS
ncbi:MAG: class I SAM-dependent methyltransferase [Candidatus Omnitrophica bacterium]|nr:class I SAM-dependent methyltransferase [Candidatus Omnitrophota bacterium]